VLQPSGVHVDRERELRRFEQMIGNQGEAHVLLISAPLGMGKSTLLEEFHRRAAGQRRATIALKSIYSPRDVLKRLCTRLGSGGFPAFNRLEEELYGLAARQLAATSATLQRAAGAIVPGLSPQTHNLLHTVLVRSPHLESDERLRNFFVRPELNPWLGDLQEASSRPARADMLISQLYRRVRHDTGESALVLLAMCLADTIDPRDSEHHQLLALAANLARELEPLAAEPSAASSHARVGGTVEDRRRRIYGWSAQAETQKQTVIELTDAFFADLAQLQAATGNLIISLIDDYDQGNAEVQEWLGDYFLESVLPYRWLIQVIAGENTPEVPIGQRDWCLSSSLSLLELAHVREYMQRLELEVGEEMVEAAYIASDGVPFYLREFTERLLRYRTGGRADAG
jgi:hypothetical protein